MNFLLVLLLLAQDAMLTGYDYPHPVRTFEFRSQGQPLAMAYVDVRPERPNGQTVLLLHGKNFSGGYWGPTIEALVARGYRVVVPDQVGFGKSSKPERYQFTFHQLARNTKALLDHLGLEEVSVVGHSMGGMLATRFALMYPDCTSRVALVNPIGLEDWQRVVPYRTIDETYAAELKATPESIRDYFRQSYFGGERKPEYEPLLTVQAGWVQGPDKARMAWISALTSDMIFTQPVVDEFPDLRPPVLLIIGQRDRTAIGRAWAPEGVRETLGDYPRLGRAAREAIPRATLVELEGVGHIPQVEAFPAYLEALTSFLAGR